MKTKKDFTLSVDKVLSIMFRIISITTCLFVVASFAVSCFAEPIRSKADYVIDDYFPNWYWDYLDDSTREFWIVEQNRQQLINPNITTSQNDSSLTSNEKEEIKQVSGLQNLFFNFWLSIYDQYSLNNFSNVPENIPVSSSGFCGLYKSDLDHLYHSFTAYSNNIPRASRSSISFVVASSDEFYYNFSCNFSSSRDVWVEPVVRSNPTTIDNVVYDQGARSMISWSLVDTLRNYSGGSGSFQDYYNNYAPLVINDTEFSISYPYYSDRYFGSNGTPFFQIGFSSSSLSLPSSSTPFDSPWIYYNEVLLPYMKQTFTTVNNNYYLFPNGYTPSVNLPELSFDPTVIAPPIVAGAGAIIVAGNVSFDIFAPISICPQFSVDGITFQFPTGGDNVYIDSLPYTIPSSGITFGDKIIDIIDKGKVIIDGVQFLLDGDDLTIDDITFNLPIGTPNIAPSEAYDYEYLIPTETLADIRLPDTSLPLNADLPSAVSSTLPALWDTIYDVLNNSGLWSIFPWLFGLSCCLYIVHKLGN